MKRKSSIAILVLTCLLFFSYAHAEEPPLEGDIVISPTDRDGSCMDRAIIVDYIGDYGKSIGQEYEYLDMKFGIRDSDWELQLQELIHDAGRYYDRLTLKIISSGEIKKLYFDITEPFQELERQLQPVSK